MSDRDHSLAEAILRASVQESMAIQERLLPEHLSVIAHIVRVLVEAFRAGHKLVLFGNGGSAADAQHVAAELVNRFLLDRDALPAMALTTNTSILTSWSNDFSFDDVFARQIRAMVQARDVAVGISTSGCSTNVLNGIQAARERGAVTIGFSGRSGALKDLTDICFCVPSDHTPRIQEAHIFAWHVICEAVEAELFGQ